MCFGLSLKEKQSLCRFIVYPQEKEEGAAQRKQSSHAWVGWSDTSNKKEGKYYGWKVESALQ